METKQYDAVILGSGQGGNPLAQKLAERGEKVAVVESGPLGGTCINTGCTPTKTLVASAQVAHYVRNAAKWGVETGGANVDFAAVMQRKDKMLQEFQAGWPKKFAKAGVDVYCARGHFCGVKEVQAGETVLAGKRIFIDTGGKATVPEIEGLRGAPYLTNETILQLKELPEHLVVLGGGYIGLEFAQMFRRFGAAVTVVHSGAQVLPQEDEDIAAALKECLEEEGIAFVMSAKTTRVRSENGGIALEIEGRPAVTGTHLLLAVGRTPQTKDLTLENTGVEVNDKGYVVVNHRLETTADDIWALGDVKSGPAFTHISYNDYQIVYGNLYEGKQLSAAERMVPYAVFTDPALGRVGITEKAARAAGKKIKTGTVKMTSVARAIERSETAGLMKIVVDAETDQVLGAAMLCAEGPELVQILGTLMLARQPYTLLKGAIYIHPTLAEGFFSLMESVPLS
jgi:pyruvate/2-oxoglutarate dehydrogenase complex dihydrolipoamide dehydrogenase (E3) component